MPDEALDPFDLHNQASDALVAGDTHAALELSLRAASAGMTSSMNNAGAVLTEQGRTEEAEHWLRAAADGEYRDRVGLPADPGGYIVPRHGEKLRSPVMLAQLNLGVLLENRGNREEARAWFERAASTGHPDALWRLALFARGQGDHEQALHWCREAAEAGSNLAQNTMGVEMAAAGDREEARRWWRLAADSGNTDAARNLERLERE